MSGLLISLVIPITSMSWFMFYSTIEFKLLSTGI